MIQLRTQVLWAGLALLGCASTVRRLPGDVPTTNGAAKNSCESASWLVPAPTRYEVPSGRGTEARTDGIGFYRVADENPESIPGLKEELGPAPLLERHGAAVRSHDRDRIIAAGLGGAGLVALVVGGVLFAGSFETTTSTASDGSRREEHDVETGSLVAGSILAGVGFGLGIAGIIVNPSAQERAEADSWRYVIVPAREDTKSAIGLVDQHNARVRARCSD